MPAAATSSPRSRTVPGLSIRPDGPPLSHEVPRPLARVTRALPAPVYITARGAAYLGDALDVMRGLPDRSVHLILTSPPFALRRKKAYGNVSQDAYKDWFLEFAGEFWRILKPQGSLVVDIGGAWNKGLPTRSLYHFRLLLALCEELQPGPFHLAQEFYWYNPAKLPTPAEWVTVRRIRVKDAVNTIWWLSKSPFPEADNRRVLRPYSASMQELLRSGYNHGLRPSEHLISAKWARDNGGAIPPNLLAISNTASGGPYLEGCRATGLKPHPARFPDALPRFFIEFLSSRGQIVLDPFAGSNVTGQEAERLGRCWIAVERNAHYLAGSRFRFLADGADAGEGREP